MFVDICICTHNPPGIFGHVLESIAGQHEKQHINRVIVIDSGSTVPLAESMLASLHCAGVKANLVREPLAGIARARLRAIGESTAEWILFVDDDNVLTPNYLQEGLDFIERHPDVGCFGGKLLLPGTITPPRWVKPFLPYLAIKDVGEEVLKGMSNEWGPWEPPTAGAFVRRSVVDLYESRATEDERLLKLGRVGRAGLGSCEDSFMMRSATSIGLSNAYNPSMVIFHYLDPRRFRLPYLLRLMYAYGSSHVLLETLLKGDIPEAPEHYLDSKSFRKLLLNSFKSVNAHAALFGLGLAVYHLGARKAHLRIRKRLQDVE